MEKMVPPVLKRSVAITFTQDDTRKRVKNVENNNIELVQKAKWIFSFY